MTVARLIGVLLAAMVCMAAASDPSERLADPAQEARARTLFREVRCLVCQNESIDDSEAPFAQDLRRIVREQVAAGRSDEEVEAFLLRRYGEYVLLRPGFNLSNLALWLAPFAIVLAGGVFLVFRARRREGEAPLSPEEEARLAALETASHGHDLAKGAVQSAQRGSPDIPNPPDRP